jgi:hypothetical protein
MRPRIAALALAMSLGLAAPASAATQFTFLNGGTVTAFGYYVGMYNGQQATPTPHAVLLNCVDFFHHVTDGQTWQANLTSIGAGAVVGPLTTRINNLTAYRAAAYLTTQYAGKTNAQIGDIQASIWQLLDPNGASNPNPPSPSTNAWKTAALNYVAADSTGASAGGFGNFWIVSDVNSFVAGQDNPNSVQEFIIYDDTFNQTVATPEPASMMLMATGLVGFAAVGIRRRKK